MDYIHSNKSRIQEEHDCNDNMKRNRFMMWINITETCHYSAKGSISPFETDTEFQTVSKFVLCAEKDA